MHMNRDIYGEYKECLMCGHMVDIEKHEAVVAEALARVKKKAAA